MSFDYSGKVILITGSSAGIGQAAALLFAKSGASVTIHGRSESGIQKTKNLILEAGIPEERIHSVKGNVTDNNVLRALVDETVAKFGKLDVLVNNVGISDKEGIKNLDSMENMDYVLDVNLKSVIRLTELAIPHLKKTKGNIVCVSSIAAFKTTPDKFYGIAKAALDHFARNYAANLAPFGVRINTLNPGATDTTFFTRHGLSDENFEKLKNRFSIPLGRWGTPKDMANFIIFMASENAEYMTGQNIIVDGGILITKT